MRSTSGQDTALMMSSNRLYRKSFKKKKKNGREKIDPSAFRLVFEKSLPFHRDPTILDGLDLTEEERNVLIDNINRRLTPQAVKIRAGLFVLPVYQEAVRWWRTVLTVFCSCLSNRHWSSVLRVWRHWCSEGSSEGWAGLFHGGHAHQGSLAAHTSLSAADGTRKHFHCWDLKQVKSCGV